MGSLWNRSGMVERHSDDIRAAGAQAFFFLGGTTTPMTVFQNSAESAAWSHPVVADANGRWPDIFIPYVVAYDVQVKTAEGVQLTFTQLIPNPNPVDTTVIVPPENQVQTGMVHGEFVNGTKAGYVRLNGKTIGSPSSTATERANVDTQNLFIHLWNNVSDAIAPVSGGRGASGAADFGANKTLTLPDMRGSTLMGLDDMGNTPKGAYSGITFSLGNATLPGSITGQATVALTLDNLPAHAHGGTTAPESLHTHNVSGATGPESGHIHFTGVSLSGVTDGPSADHSHQYGDAPASFFPVSSGPTGSAQMNTATGITGGASNPHTHNWGASGTFQSGAGTAHSHGVNINSAAGSPHSHTFSTDSQGGGQSFNNLTPINLITWFIKL